MVADASLSKPRYEWPPEQAPEGEWERGGIADPIIR